MINISSRDLDVCRVDCAFEAEWKIFSACGLANIGELPVGYAAGDGLLYRVRVEQTREQGRGEECVAHSLCAPLLKGRRPVAYKKIRADAALDLVDVHKLIDDELNDCGCGAGMHIPEVDESDLVIFSEKGDVVVASPNTVPEVTTGFLNVVVKLRDLGRVDADTWQLFLNLVPSENAAGVFGKRPCGLGDGEHKAAFVSSCRGSMLPDYSLNEGPSSLLILHALFG